MVLDRAQFLAPPSGNPLDGIGAVKAGANITIAADGTISSTGGGSGGVTRLIAGSNITLNPTTGVGDVTISATGGGTGGVSQLVAGSGISLSPASGTGVVTITNTGGGGGGGVTSVTSTSQQLIASPTTGAVNLSFQQNVVFTFDPINGTTGTGWSGRTGGGSMGTINFTIPDGATSAMVWSRCRMMIYADTTGLGTNEVFWCTNATYTLTGGNCTVLTGGVAQMPYLSVVARQGRGCGTCFVRFDIINVPGTGNRSCSLSFPTNVENGSGNTDWHATLDNPQVIILPFHL